MEGTSYLKEIGGGEKEKESFRQFIKARRFLKKRYGKIYIRFSEPISLNEYISRTDMDQHDVNRDLAFELVRNINKVTLVTPLSLIGTAILANHRKGFLISELTATAGIFMDFLKKNNVLMADTLNDLSKAVRDTIALLISWKVVDFMKDAPGEEETFYFMEDDKKLELEYYKNSIIHFFIQNSFVAVSLLIGKEDSKKQNEIISDYIYLDNLFSNEFVSDDMDPEKKVHNIINYFVKTGLLSYSDDNEGYKITKSGFDNLPIWASLAKTFIESYWISSVIMNQPEEKRGSGEILLKNMAYHGKRYHKMGVVEHIGSLSRLNFQNAITFINKNIINRSDSDKTDQHPSFADLTSFSKKLYDLIHYGQ
jgi:glycerol-3-phosphate O-acyltransferase